MYFSRHFALAPGTSLEHCSRQRVETALTQLEQEYRIERHRRETWSVPAAEYKRTVARFEKGTLGGAGAWITNDAGEVLLVREDSNGPWSEPSGKHESDETLPETARREVREETGIVCELTGIELAQIVETRDDTTSDPPPVYRLIVVFGADYVADRPSPPKDEIISIRWFNDYPAHLLYDALTELPIPAAAGN